VLLEVDFVGHRPACDLSGLGGIEPEASQQRLLKGAEPLPEPRDPVDELDELLSVEASPAEWAESRARLAAAAAKGLPEYVAIDVALAVGTVTVERIPTASREAAWQVIDRAAREHGGYGPMGPLLTGAVDDGHARRFAAWLLAERRTGARG
jgi:hypothetical protein